MNFDFEKYSTKYTDKKLFEKLKKFSLKAGKKLVYVVLLLYYTLQKDNVPKKVKAVIIGALGYFISPFDVITDFLPIIGYTDDFGALMMALAVVAIYIDKETKSRAKSRLESWFGEVDESELEEVNSKL
ncbi:YkvA family protein [Pelosinus propionicus]|uniref:DUF1232 domain-containing protein n=1 Tax=Pelosinus propionicus DSM 13327 TaxID=1123291 RepID=A0A1I4I7A1_9FIRM|nr:YkvA family protein [Pelosinus propionicus]SFL50288.1 Protein of unknown function [Pelosinus propionicus DSM 13327]